MAQAAGRRALPAAWDVRLRKTRMVFARMRQCRGFTLIELMLGASILAIAIVALMGAFFGQSYLNENARNMTSAMNDATRIMEQIRQQNTNDREPCKTQKLPTALAVDATGTRVAVNWNSWLETSTGGKSVNRQLADAADRNKAELIAITCQDGSSTQRPAPHCGPNQASPQEWFGNIKQPTTFDPIRVTVAVSWREGQRSGGGGGPSGELVYLPAHVAQPCTGGCTRQIDCVQGNAPAMVPEQFVITDQDGDGTIEAPAMLTTLISCR